MKLGRAGRASDIEDRRGQGGGMGGGGRMGLPFPSSTGGRVGGIGGLAGIVILVVTLLMNSGGGGGNTNVIGGGNNNVVSGGSPGATGVPDDQAGAEASATFSDVQDSWEQLFTARGQTYRRSRLVLFRGSTTSGCGPASSSTGPFYCPADEKVYIDLSFYGQLQRDFGAKGGDFAQAYITAHEVGHHVQNLLGTNAQVQQQSGRNPNVRNDLSVRLELQADCYAGVWARGFESRQGNVLEPGDVSEALDAASSVGDDRIQSKVQGRIDPESWTHGSAEQRQQWFTIGYQQGQPEACDTFRG